MSNHITTFLHVLENAPSEPIRTRQLELAFYVGMLPLPNEMIFVTADRSTTVDTTYIVVSRKVRWPSEVWDLFVRIVEKAEIV